MSDLLSATGRSVASKLEAEQRNIELRRKLGQAAKEIQRLQTLLRTYGAPDHELRFDTMSMLQEESMLQEDLKKLSCDPSVSDRSLKKQQSDGKRAQHGLTQEAIGERTFPADCVPDLFYLGNTIRIEASCDSGAEADSEQEDLAVETSKFVTETDKATGKPTADAVSNGKYDKNQVIDAVKHEIASKTESAHNDVLIDREKDAERDAKNDAENDTENEDREANVVPAKLYAFGLLAQNKKYGFEDSALLGGQLENSHSSDSIVTAPPPGVTPQKSSRRVAETSSANRESNADVNTVADENAVTKTSSTELNKTISPDVEGAHPEDDLEGGHANDDIQDADPDDECELQGRAESKLESRARVEEEMRRKFFGKSTPPPTNKDTTFSTTVLLQNADPFQDDSMRQRKEHCAGIESEQTANLVENPLEISNIITEPLHSPISVVTHLCSPLDAQLGGNLTNASNTGIKISDSKLRVTDSDIFPHTKKSLANDLCLRHYDEAARDGSRSARDGSGSAKDSSAKDSTARNSRFQNGFTERQALSQRPTLGWGKVFTSLPMRVVAGQNSVSRTSSAEPSQAVSTTSMISNTGSVISALYRDAKSDFKKSPATFEYRGIGLPAGFRPFGSAAGARPPPVFGKNNLLRAAKPATFYSGNFNTAKLLTAQSTLPTQSQAVSQADQNEVDRNQAGSREQGYSEAAQGRTPEDGLSASRASRKMVSKVASSVNTRSVKTGVTTSSHFCEHDPRGSHHDEDLEVPSESEVGRTTGKTKGDSSARSTSTSMFPASTSGNTNNYPFLGNYTAKPTASPMTVTGVSQIRAFSTRRGAQLSALQYPRFQKQPMIRTPDTTMRPLEGSGTASGTTIKPAAASQNGATPFRTNLATKLPIFANVKTMGNSTANFSSVKTPVTSATTALGTGAEAELEVQS